MWNCWLNGQKITWSNMLLEWPEHDRELVAGLSQLHQLDAFCDVTLSAEGRQIKAHRVILASASTYFKVRFFSWIENLFLYANVVDRKKLFWQNWYCIILLWWFILTPFLLMCLTFHLSDTHKKERYRLKVSIYLYFSGAFTHRHRWSVSNCLSQRCQIQWLGKSNKIHLQRENRNTCS